MTWFDAEIDSSMMAIRAIHFAATAAIAGALVFRAVVAEPALRCQREASAVIEPQIRKVAWTGLVVVITSGVGWVLLLTMSLSGESVGEAIMSGALSDVVTLTQFGIVAQVRLALAIALGICLTLDRFPLARWLALGAALCLIASIAWTGHAASTPHALGYVHLAADALHLYAASAWIGGLAPLALLLRIGRRYHASAWVKLELEAVRRFSSLGMASVAVLIVSGMINAWILVGSLRALVLTTYGWILMIKLAVFAAMLAFAAVNRFRLTPALASPTGSEAHDRALRLVTRNTLIEIALALVVFAIVGALGTLHPAAHLVS
jgi:putative copper resistance protein D